MTQAVIPASLLPTDLVDEGVLRRTVDRFRQQRIVLPTFAELAAPGGLAVSDAIDPDAADPANLLRVNWFNGWDRTSRVSVPLHIELPRSLTGVDARIVLMVGRVFPMIRAHKVLAAYACLVPRLVTGSFDPTAQRAIWPSTGNYARGGVAISKLMGCRGVAILPEGMSQERFDWLEQWTDGPDDVIRTPGSESNVKEIYDACNLLATDPANVILNQFSEYANHLAHWRVTGAAAGRVFDAVSASASGPAPRLAAFVSATGSAGTIAAGDWLKDRYGAAVVAVEALECPTMLYNGYGAHNIQGIGDKHIPLIHNVTNTDVVAAVSDAATDSLDVLFNTDAGCAWLVENGHVSAELAGLLPSLGFSSICNVLAAIKTARLWDLGPHDVVLTVATDGAELYGSEREKFIAERFPGGFDTEAAATTFATHLAAVSTGHVQELSHVERNRVFNLGYFTWVEQQGIELEHFDARRDQGFWRDLRPVVDQWDGLICEFNERVSAAG